MYTSENFNCTAKTSKLPRIHFKMSVISACPYSVVTFIRIKVCFQYTHGPSILGSKVFIKLTDPPDDRLHWTQALLTQLIFWTPKNFHRYKPWLAVLQITSLLLTSRSLKPKLLHFICRQEAVWKQDSVEKRQSNSLLLGAFADQVIVTTSLTIQVAKLWSEIFWETVAPSILEIFKTNGTRPSATWSNF